MLGALKHIKIDGKEYPIAFTLNVMEAIQDEYGSMEKWLNVMEPGEGEEIKIKDLIWIFKEMINEGIDIENEEKGEKRSFLTHKQVGRLVSAIGMKDGQEFIKSLTIESVKTDEEKNLTPTQNQSN